MCQQSILIWEQLLNWKQGLLAGALILLLKTLKIFAGGTEDAEDTDIVALGSTGSGSVAEHSDLWTSAEWEAGLQGLLEKVLF